MLSPLFVGALAVAGAFGPFAEPATAFARAPATPFELASMTDVPPLRVPAVYRVPELRVPGLPDAAMAEMTWRGPVILYNPEICAEAGPALEFLRAHEYAHVLFGHLVTPAMLSTRAGRKKAEAQADCEAARASSPAAVRAMVELVLQQPSGPREAIYGTSAQRAGHILACASLPL